MISQINFDEKSRIENHVLMAGDAAGMITPLCGNGMSMAMHASKIAFECFNDYLQGKNQPHANGTAIFAFMEKAICQAALDRS